MQLPGTAEWLYRNDCAVLPFRWSNANCCGEGFSDPDRGDCRDNLAADIRFGRDPKIVGSHPASEEVNDSTHASLPEENDEATCASSIGARIDEDATIGYQSAEPNCGSEEHLQGQTTRTIQQVMPLTAPFESTSVVTNTDEHLDSQEEMKRWISAAGVSTPSELERKIADMSRAASQNEADVKDLTCHVLEVKSLLLQLHEVDKYIAKRRRRCGQSSTRRKRSRQGYDPVECYPVSSVQSSSTERATERGGGPLLDPEIMNSFRNLINLQIRGNCAPLGRTERG